MSHFTIKDKNKPPKEVSHQRIKELHKRVKVQFYLRKVTSHQIIWKKQMFRVLGIKDLVKRKTFLMTAVHQMRIISKATHNKHNKTRGPIILCKVRKQTNSVIKRQIHTNLRKSSICFQDKRNKKSLREYI